MNYIGKIKEVCSENLKKLPHTNKTFQITTLITLLIINGLFIYNVVKVTTSEKPYGDLRSRASETTVTPPPNIFGINERDLNWQTPEVRGWMKDTEAFYLRAGLFWYPYQQTIDSPIDLHIHPSIDLDDRMTYLNDEMIPVIIVDGAPSWAAQTPDGPFINNNNGPFVIFIKTVAERYDGDCDLNGDGDCNDTNVGGNQDWDEAPETAYAKIDYWQMYNEPDNKITYNINDPSKLVTDGWGDNPEAYAEMLMAVYPVIKIANPSAQVIFGSVAAENETYINFSKTTSIDFTKRVLSHLRFKAFDVFALHYYPKYQNTWDDPNNYNYWLTPKVNYFRNLLTSINRSYYENMPFIITESGRRSIDNKIILGEVASETAQGNWYWKMNTQALHDKLKMMILYSTNDTFDFPDEPDKDSWGIINKLLTPTVTWTKKASYDSYRQSVSVLKNYTYKTRINNITGMEVHTLTKYDGSPLTVFWSRNPDPVSTNLTPTIDFPVIPGGSLEVYDIYGIPTIYPDIGGGKARVATKDPKYVYEFPYGYFTPSPTPTSTPSDSFVKTEEFFAIEGIDDAYQQQNGNIYLTTPQIRLGQYYTYIGFRVTGSKLIDLKGKVINKAIFKVSAADTTSAADITEQVYLQASDNCLSFSTASNNIGSRPLTKTYQTWTTGTRKWILDERVPTPDIDISKEVSEVVNRPNWEKKSLCIILKKGVFGGFVDRLIYAKESNHTPASLKITYSTSGIIPTPTSTRIPTPTPTNISIPTPTKTPTPFPTLTTTPTPFVTNTPTVSIDLPASCSGIGLTNRTPYVNTTINPSGIAQDGTGVYKIIAYLFDFGDGTNTGWKTVVAWSGNISASKKYTKTGNFTIQFKIKLQNGQILGGSGTKCALSIPVIPTPTP